jgi:hypothetical protein
MVIENDPSARMQVRSMGELMHPAQCMVCGNGNCDEGYLDLGVFYDYEGHMYLCMICATQAGETIGLFTPDEVKSQQELIEKLTNENESLTAEVTDARPVLDALSNLFGMPLGIDDLDSAAISAVADTEPVNVTEAVSGTDSGESEPEEPVANKRRGNSTRVKSGNITFQ